ncbi:MAG: cell envelope integrity protein CreD [Proteobacteria bacterium]|nr:cell envelope integrity protein CreD [Pseudomonadota bacterium]
MESIDKPRFSFTQKISFKLLVIFCLIILLQIPLFLVTDIIRDRQSMQQQAQDSISQRWGSNQYIGAPVIIKNNYVINDKDKKQLVSDFSAATSANYSIDLQVQKRYLGIFESAIYTAGIELTGEIDSTNLQPLNTTTQLFIPMREVHSIKNIEGVFINGIKINSPPQYKTHQNIQGFILDVSTLNLPNTFNYRIKMQLTGSKALSIVPNATNSSVVMNSNWASPSFIGNYLPDSREISEQGFTAKWNIHHLNFTYPINTVAATSNHFVYESEVKKFGVKIIIPANTYQVITRTAKYSMLIILLSFAGLFLAEVFFKIRLHPFQYLLIGVSLSLFYLLLLSLSEYLRFNFAFLLSALSTIALIAGYCAVILGQRMRGIYTGILFTVLYGFIFALVKSEESSLLMGSIGLWIVLALIMYLTREINWYESNK